MHQDSKTKKSSAASHFESWQSDEERRTLLIAVVRNDSCAVKQALSTVFDRANVEHALRVASGLGNSDVASLIFRSALPDVADTLDGALVAAIKNGHVLTVHRLLLEASRLAEPPSLVKSLYAAALAGEVGVIDAIMSAHRPSNKSVLNVFRAMMAEKRWAAVVHIYDGYGAKLFDRRINDSDRKGMEGYRAHRRANAVREELVAFTEPLATGRSHLPKRRI